MTSLASVRKGANRANRTPPGRADELKARDSKKPALEGRASVRWWNQCLRRTRYGRLGDVTLARVDEIGDGALHGELPVGLGSGTLHSVEGSLLGSTELGLSICRHETGSAGAYQLQLGHIPALSPGRPSGGASAR